MNALFRNILVQFREFFKTLTPVKRISIIGAMVVVLMAIMATLLMLSGREFAPLLTNIPSDQTALIVDKLRTRNVPFRLEDDGKTILVPSELVHSTQMMLMAEIGSTKIGTIGFEIFDKEDFGATSFHQRINHQRALQGELMRAINTLDAVKRSKVILSLPAKKTFLEEGAKASASVVVELHAGKTLSAEQVRGITYLVSSAVEGLDQEKVSVVDSRGKLLSKVSDGAGGLNAQMAELKHNIEQELEERIESILSKAVGAGRVVARVNAQLNHKIVNTTEETVDPDRTAVFSVQTEEEKLDGSRTNPTGVPGARANLPGAQEAGQVGFQQNVNKELKTTNYSVPKTVKNTKEAAGGLERISVAVLVDGVVEHKKGEKGEIVDEWKPRAPEELAKYEALVRNAVGYVETRGDSVKIETIRFNPEDFTEAERFMSTLERKKLVNALLKWMVLGSALLLFFILVIRPFMRWVTDSFQDSVEDLLPRTIEELEELQSVDNSLPGMSSALPMLEESLDPDKAESELLRERVMAILEKDEEKAAGAFSLWLVRKEI